MEPTRDSVSSYGQNSLIQTASSPFLARVFLYFGLAVAVSALGAWTGFTYLAPVFIGNPMLMYALFAVELILVFTSRAWSTKRPINYLLFSLFAFITGVTIVPLLMLTMLEFGGAGLIVKALLATTLMFSGAALFGYTTNRNLAGLGGFLMISLIGVIVVSVAGIFVPWNNTFEMFFSGFGVILFSAYVMYDMQKLKSFPQDRAMDAALMLYLNMFNLFIFILRFMGAVSRD